MISVVIPTYNRAEFVLEAVKSVLNQTYQDFELIVVDDGSTDETCNVIASAIGAKQSQIKVLRQENKGVSAARNAGIKEAKGEWIAFLDSDDLWKKEKLEKQMQWLQSHPQEKICHTDEIWVRNGRRVNPMKKHAKPAGWIFEQCLPMCVVSPSSILIHQSLFEKYGVFDETLPACEDYDLWLRLSAKVPFGFLPQKLLTKRGGHEDQLSQKHWGLDRFRVQSLLKLIDSGDLKPAQLNAATKELKKKCQILANGAEKRGKKEESIKYLNLTNSIQQEKSC